ncbi:alpha-crystallin A chain [Parasteatoda tepidariorum]|uniref:alpha-crystallin A chain n=1 Tax=Parasteatoda tepidariorum TaxID=114398 RepID=UPI00077F9B59|nr:heat shock protein beta-1 [Parasteatoda tepidariorum]
MPFERRLPLLRSDFSVIDREFSSIREKFDQEMRVMEDEMNRFRSQLMDRETPRLQSHSASTGTDGATTHKSEVRTWLDGLSSPLIQDCDDGKKLRLRFDVSQYQPEEIVVKTVDNKLQVQAKHEEKSETKSVYREYNREFLLPKGTNPEMIKSSLSTDGVLTVEAPLPAIEGVHMIPIENK